MYNQYRITRILKCLGETGYEHYKKPFLAHIHSELVQGNLQNCRQSAVDYWFPLLRSDTDKQELAELLEAQPLPEAAPRYQRRNDW